MPVGDWQNAQDVLNWRLGSTDWTGREANSAASALPQHPNYHCMAQSQGGASWC